MFESFSKFALFSFIFLSKLSVSNAFINGIRIFELLFSKRFRVEIFGEIKIRHLKSQ